MWKIKSISYGKIHMKNVSRKIKSLSQTQENTWHMLKKKTGAQLPNPFKRWKTEIHLLFQSKTPMKAPAVLLLKDFLFLTTPPISPERNGMAPEDGLRPSFILFSHLQENIAWS